MQGGGVEAGAGLQGVEADGVVAHGFQQGVFVAEQIAGLDPTPIDEAGIPRVTYCDPEVASVGLNESVAVEKFGADALRFGLAYLATETQDVRMPVDLVDPHSGVAFQPEKIKSDGSFHRLKVELKGPNTRGARPERVERGTPREAPKARSPRRVARFLAATKWRVPRSGTRAKRAPNRSTVRAGSAEGATGT